jgi:hypothetical protein
MIIEVHNKMKKVNGSIGRGYEVGAYSLMSFIVWEGEEEEACRALKGLVGRVKVQQFDNSLITGEYIAEVPNK